MKPLSESKTRLSPHISPERRAALSLDMLSWVVGVLGESRVERVVVIGGDDAVRAASLAGGAEWMADEYLDLNKAVLHVFKTAWAGGEVGGVPAGRSAASDRFGRGRGYRGVVGRGGFDYMPSARRWDERADSAAGRRVLSAPGFGQLRAAQGTGGRTGHRDARTAFGGIRPRRGHDRRPARLRSDGRALS